MAVENLQATFGFYFDKGLWADAADLFARSGSFEYGQSGVYITPERIRKALLLFGPEGLAPGYLNNHMMLQAIITVADDGKTATGRFQGPMMLSEPGQNGVWGVGIYENEYVKDGGVWKFAKLHFYPTALTDYDRGLGAFAAADEGPSAVYPPDKPPTVVYRTMPGNYIPPFSYKASGDGQAAHRSTASRGQRHGSRTMKRNITFVAPLAAALAALLAAPAFAQSAADKLDALDKRITRLEDLNAIERVQRAYGYFVDKSQWTQLSELFTDDATLEIGGKGLFLGKPRVLEYMQTAFGKDGAKENSLANHMQFQSIPDVSEDGKTGWIRSRAYVMSIGGWGLPLYENEYRKENGVWKESRLTGPFTMYSSWTAGARTP